MITEEKLENLRKQLRDKNRKMNPKQMYKDIIETNNLDFIKDCIIDNSYNIPELLKIKLLKDVNNMDVIRECLNIKNAKIAPIKKVQIIESMSKAEGYLDFVKEFVNDGNTDLNGVHKTHLIKTTNDLDYVKECIRNEKLNLDENNKVKLIQFTQELDKDLDYIKDCIKDKDIGLKPQNVVIVLNSIKDTDDIRECLLDKSLGLTEGQKIDIIKARDELFRKECISSDDFELSTNQKNLLAIQIKDYEYVKKYFSNNMAKVKDIKLPESVTIGMEIETENIVILNDLFEDWVAEHDGSLERGTEFVSPVITSDHKYAEQIYTICNAIKSCKGIVSERCGGHIHIGANYLTNTQSFLNLIELWGNAEEILYIISNKEGEVPRESSVTSFARPLSRKLEEALAEGKINITEETEISSIAKQLQEAQVNRYCGINFMNMKPDGINTIEFRISNGTIDPETWIDNINLYGGIIGASEKLYQIQQEEQRTPEDMEFLEAFNNLKDEEASKEEKLESLLKLTTIEENRDIYRNRYKTNNELMMKENKTFEKLQEQTANKPITIKKIGKLVFTGDKAVSTEMMKEAELRVNRDMQQMQKDEDERGGEY